MCFFTQLFGRTVKASIAIDNGRAAEFIRRRNYTDKTRCYECGVSACFSFLCFCGNNTCMLINISVVSEWNFNCAFTFKSSQDSGHLSYACPKNLLGEREPPKKKEKKRKKKAQQPEHVYVSCSKKIEFVFSQLVASNYILIHFLLVKRRKKVKKREKTQP